MAQGIGAVLAFAVGVAISPVPIIAVTLMLFSAARPGERLGVPTRLGPGGRRRQRRRLHPRRPGRCGHQQHGSRHHCLGQDRASACSSCCWPLRNWQNRPAPGTKPAMPKWMAGVDALTPAKAFGLSLLLAGSNPKNLILARVGRRGARRARAFDGRGRRFADRLRRRRQPQHRGAGRLRLVGGEKAKARLDEMKDWLVLHNDAVMAVLFLVFGAELIADGLPSLG